MQMVSDKPLQTNPKEVFRLFGCESLIKIRDFPPRFEQLCFQVSLVDGTGFSLIQSLASAIYE